MISATGPTGAATAKTVRAAAGVTVNVNEKLRVLGKEVYVYDFHDRRFCSPGSPGIVLRLQEHDQALQAAQIRRPHCRQCVRLRNSLGSAGPDALGNIWLI